MQIHGRLLQKAIQVHNRVLLVQNLHFPRYFPMIFLNTRTKREGEGIDEIQKAAVAFHVKAIKLLSALIIVRLNYSFLYLSIFKCWGCAASLSASDNPLNRHV